MFNESLVTTTHGRVRGQVLGGVHVFKGIRYGADTGTYRFLPPRPPAPWVEVANAFEYGPTCPQDDPDTAIRRDENPFLQRIGLTDSLPESEDCLFVNVWTPGTDRSDRPVLVWVHSGGFASNSGSSPAIDGSVLAAQGDAVIVTFNHRLNVFGYAQVTDDPASPFFRSGNVGMLDIVFLLQWVRDNIAAFGGDPGRVTVFGQSGGAMKISTLLAMPEAQGLFHGAIMQSGATPRLIDLDRAVELGRELVGNAGVRFGDGEAAQQINVQDLVRAYGPIAARDGLTAFGATVDGSVIPHQPFAVEGAATADDSAAAASRIPLIVGDLDTETGLFFAGTAPVVKAWSLDDLRARLGRLLGEEEAGRLVAAFHELYPGDDAHQLLVHMSSAGIFTANTGDVARQASALGHPVRRYRITVRTPVDEGIFGSPHEMDVALTFGNVETARGLNSGGPDAHRLSEVLRDAWLRFAHTGSPEGDGLVWPTTDDGAVLLLTPEPQVQEHFVDKDAEALDGARDVNWFALLAD